MDTLSYYLQGSNIIIYIIEFKSDFSVISKPYLFIFFIISSYSLTSFFLSDFFFNSRLSFLNYSYF